MKTPFRLRLAGALVALVALSGLALPSTVLADDAAKDPATAACETLMRIASLDEQTKGWSEGIAACREGMASVSAGCTNGDAVLGCIAALDPKNPDAMSGGLSLCMQRCAPAGQSGGTGTRATPPPTSGPPSAEVKQACENLASVARTMGEDVGAEDMPECYEGLESMLGECPDRGAALKCMSTASTEAEVMACIEPCLQ